MNLDWTNSSGCDGRNGDDDPSLAVMRETTLASFVSQGKSPFLSPALTITNGPGTDTLAISRTPARVPSQWEPGFSPAVPHPQRRRKEGLRPRRVLVAGSKWHDEAMLDEGITTRYGVLPLMPSRQNPCGKPATRLRLLLSAVHSVSEPESSPNFPPPPPPPARFPSAPSRYTWAPSRSGRHRRTTMRNRRTRFAGEEPTCTACCLHWFPNQDISLGRTSHASFETPMTGAPSSWWDEVAWNIRWQALSLSSALQTLVVVDTMRPWK